MSKTTRTEHCLNQYTLAIQKAYGINDATKQFSLSEPMEIKLRQKILESDAFLKELSLLDVDQIQGQVIDVGTGTLMTGRGDNARFRAYPGKDGIKYELVETDSCWAVTWAELAVWGNSGTEGQFIKLMTNNANKNFALDMLKIGFNGIKVARPTAPSTYPLGQDVNKGWQQFVKERAPEQIVTTPVYLDAGGKGTYKNLDSMVQDLINSQIDPVYQNDPNLVVLVGRDLVSAEQHRLLEAADTPTEHKAAQSLAKTIAGRKAYVPPFFPGKRVVVTFLKNLQILTQKGSRRRKAADNEDRMQFESSYWRMEGYAVGRLEAYASFDESAVTIGPNPDAPQAAPASLTLDAKEPKEPKEPESGADAQAKTKAGSKDKEATGNGPASTADVAASLVSE
ncbi:phage major capsid protein, P2 family [Shewanella algae]|uniref:phage major capsid protein, P2 family n=1 Tax=Shewanella algae TaxID=38313 RepID=UPI001AAFF40B|nr:phage major capsid protein, P2 family [Shewanella algae]MBO2631125.1 phage major capsid protein, P2 family [Shewanella algae]